MARYALLIGNSHYDDENLHQLSLPEADVAAFAEILRDPELGDFDEVLTLIDKPHYTALIEISRFFKKGGYDDLLLMFFAGHGVKDRSGQLYLTFRNSEADILDGTAIADAFVAKKMDESVSERQILILDCCYSGAFGRNARAGLGSSAGVSEAYHEIIDNDSGIGKMVLTASDAIQFAFESGEVVGSAQNSLFTHYLIEGIRSGAADRNQDGDVTVDELYLYIDEQIRKITYDQRPQLIARPGQRYGEIIIAKSPILDTGLQFPFVLQGMLTSEMLDIRLSSVNVLLKYAKGNTEFTELAKQQLEFMANNDESEDVRQAAALYFYEQDVLRRAKEKEAEATKIEAEFAEIERKRAELEELRKEEEHKRAEFEKLRQKRKQQQWLARIPTIFLILTVVLLVGSVIGAFTFLPELINSDPVETSTEVVSGSDEPSDTKEAHEIETSSPEPTQDVTNVVTEEWQRGSGGIGQLDWSLDGSLIAFSSSDGVHVYDASTLSEIRHIPTETGTTAVAFNSDRSLLAAGLWKTRDVLLANPQTGEIIEIFDVYDSSMWNSVETVAFSPDDKLLAVLSEYQDIVIYNLDSGNIINEISSQDIWSNGDGPPVAFSSDGEKIAYNIDDATSFIVRDIITDEQIFRVDIPDSGRIEDLAFGLDGNWIASGSWDRTVKIWDATTGAQLRELSFPANVYVIEVSPDGRWLAAGGWTGPILVWDTQSWEQVYRLDGHTQASSHLAFSPDGSKLASSGWDATLRIWNLETGEQESVLNFESAGGYSVSFSEDSSRVASLSSGNSIRIWNPENGLELYHLFGDSFRPTTRIDLSPDGTMLAFGAWTWGTAWVWDLEAEREMFQIFIGDGITVSSVAFSPDQQYLAVGAEEIGISVWSISTQEQLWFYEISGFPDDLTYSPDGSQLTAAYSQGSRLLVLDASNGAVLENSPLPSESRSVAYSTDGEIIAVGGDGFVRFVDTEDFTNIGSIQVRNSDISAPSVSGISFSPKNDIIAISDLAGQVCLWAYPSEESLGCTEDFTMPVEDVEFSSDGKWLAAGSGSGFFRMWSVNDE